MKISIQLSCDGITWKMYLLTPSSEWQQELVDQRLSEYRDIPSPGFRVEHRQDDAQIYLVIRKLKYPYLNDPLFSAIEIVVPNCIQEEWTEIKLINGVGYRYRIRDPNKPRIPEKYFINVPDRKISSEICQSDLGVVTLTKKMVSGVMAWSLDSILGFLFSFENDDAGVHCIMVNRVFSNDVLKVKEWLALNEGGRKSYMVRKIDGYEIFLDNGVSINLLDSDIDWSGD